MNKENIIAGLVGLVIGIFITPFFAPAMPMMWGNRMMNWNSKIVDNRLNQIDGHFIEEMIPHHEDAITMADLALVKAEHPEIKKLAKDVIKTQSEEIIQMKAWYKEWFNDDVPDVSNSMGHGMNMMMHGGMMGDATDLENLETSKPFDKAFIEEMIPHHQMAVMMAQMLSNATNRSEMKELTENIISAQTKEINQMRNWYRSWY